MRQKFLSFSLIFVLVLGVLAQERRDETSTPSVERLRAHVSYLASDKLEGRRTGSAGATDAAEYVAREFARYGLRRSIGQDLPGMSILEADSPRRYMQEFPYVAGVELGKNNSISYASKLTPATPQANASGVPAASPSLRLGEDWMPLGFSSSANLSGLPAMFVGYGIKANELNYDDYAGVPVVNHIAVALAGTPDDDNPHGEFARYADVRWKAITAQHSGAAALVIVAREKNFKDDKLSQLRYDNSSGEAGLPVVVISRQAAERIFEAGWLPPVDDMEHGTREIIKAPAPESAAEKRKNASVDFSGLTFNLSTELVRRAAPAYNVVGILEGSDPALKGEAIVIGAHYDHLGRGGQGSLAQREGDVHHGADDNASGVAGVLELARIFSAERARMKRTLVFIAFSGEEEGLLGSNYYVNHPVWPLDKTVAMINMDMIGRMKEKRLMIGGVGTAAEWRKWIVITNSSPGPAAIGATEQTSPNSLRTDVLLSLPQRLNLTMNEDGYGPSDHSSFYAKNVPVLFFFTGTHDDYHKPSDTAEKINYEGEVEVISLVAGMVRLMDDGGRRPTYAVAKSQSQGRSMGFRVYLGTIPNYAESNDGLKLDGVREDSPAATAGLKAGDKVIKLAGREVRNVYDYTAVLGEMKAGQEYEVEVVRAGQTLKLKITPAKRN